MRGSWSFRLPRTGAWMAATCCALLLASCSGTASPRGSGPADGQPSTAGTPPAPPAGANRPATPGGDPSNRGQPAPAPHSSHTPGIDLAARLRRAATPVLAGADGHASVAVENLSTGRHAWYGAAGHRFPTASIIKVDILATLLWQSQQQGRDLPAASDRWARRMIEHSDNAAATALWGVIGGADKLAAANERFGMGQTTPNTGGYWGLTTTTASDQLRLLRMVLTHRSVLDAHARRYARGLLTHVQADQRFGLDSAADEGSDLAVKDGWLLIDRTGRWTINSIGMVVHNGRRLLLAVLCDGQPTRAVGTVLAGRLARAAGDVAAPPPGPTDHTTASTTPSTATTG